MTGWGRKELNGTIQNRMRTIDVPFLELKTCKRLFRWVARVNDDMVCTGTEDGGVTPCYGDSVRISLEYFIQLQFLMSSFSLAYN